MTNLPLECMLSGFVGMGCEVFFTGFKNYRGDYLPENGGPNIRDSESVYKRGELTGHTPLVMYPLYALAPLAAEGVKQMAPWIDDIPIYAQAAVFAPIIIGGEALYGAFLRSVKGEAPWQRDYKDKWDSMFGGLCRASYLPFWGAFGVFAYRLHNWMSPVQSFF